MVDVPARQMMPAPEMQRIARVMKGRWLESAHSRVSQEREREIDYRRADPQYINPLNVKQQPRVKYSYTFRTLRHKLGALVGGLQQDRSWRTAFSSSPEYGEFGPTLTKWLGYNAGLPHHDFKKNNDWVLERGLQMGLKYGVNWYTARWHEDPEWWGVRFENVPWEDVFTDWKEGRWYVVRSYVPVWKIVELAKDWLTIPVVNPETGEEVYNAPEQIARNIDHLIDEVKKGTSSIHRYAFWWSVDRNRHQRDTGKVDDDDEYGDQYFVRQEDDWRMVRVPVLEYYERRPGGMVYRIIPGYDDGEDLLMYAAPAAYRFSQIVPFIPYPVDEEESGFSLPYIIGQADEIMSWTLRAQLRYIARTADPAVLKTSEAQLKGHSTEVLSNRIIEVPDKDAVSFMDPPSNPSMHHLGFMVMKGAADDGIAMSPQQRGQVERGTATGQNIAAKNAGVDDGLLLSCAKQSFAQLSRLAIEILRVNLTEERAIAIMGLDGAHEVLKLKPDAMKGSYAIQIRGPLVQTDPQIQAAAIDIGFTTYGPGVVDPQRAFLARMRLVGVDNVEELLTNRDAKPAKSPRREHMAFMTGQTQILPSPRENLQQHLMEHTQFQKDLQAQMPPEHPIHQAVQDHIELTIMLAQSLMQQTPQQGSQPIDNGVGGNGSGSGGGSMGGGAPGTPGVDQMRRDGGNPATNPNVPPLAPNRMSTVR